MTGPFHGHYKPGSRIILLSNDGQKFAVDRFLLTKNRWVLSPITRWSKARTLKTRIAPSSAICSSCQPRPKGKLDTQRWRTRVGRARWGQRSW